MNLSGIKRRVNRLVGDCEEPIPPEDSIAFQMRYLCFPMMFKEASHLSEKEKRFVLDLDPLTYEEGYSRDTVREAQRVIRESMGASSDIRAYQID